MPSLRIRVRAVARVPAPTADAEGEHLAELVQRAVEAGAAAPVAVVVRADRTELLSMRPVIEARLRSGPFLAGLTRSNPDAHGPALAVGVAGRFLLRRRTGAPVPVALAFLEWPDCRWWHWQQLLDPEGQPLPDTDFVRRAEDGDALPAGLGRWWSLGRRTGATVTFGRPEPALPPAEPPLVH